MQIQPILIAAVTFVLAASMAPACAKEKSAPKDQAAATPTATQGKGTEKGPEHAAEGAKPGSHEDWCAEHQVAESQCTRCNPDLIAAFKATGDWCVEHGLPESQCLKCNPDLKIVRPPKTE